jgi:hypothetical protein
MSKTYVFQDQITGSFLDEINDNVNLVSGRATLVDDLNILRTQIRKVLNGAGTWTDTPPLDLHEIHARFTGSLTLNILTGSHALFHNDLNVNGNSLIAGTLAVVDNFTAISDLCAQSNLNVYGNSEFVGKVSLLDETAVFGNFSAIADFEALGSSYLKSTLYVSGSSEFFDKVLALDDVSVLGNFATMGSSEISGESYLKSNAYVSGSVEVNLGVSAKLGLSGSLTRLTDGSPAFVAGSGISITSSSNGPIIISSSATSNTAKGFLLGNSMSIDKVTGQINFGPSGAGIGTLTASSEEVIDVYLNGVYLTYNCDIFDITSESFRLDESLINSLVEEDIISIVLRSV